MKKNSILKVVFAAGCLIALGIAGTYTVYANSNYSNGEVVCEGVHIGSLDVGGMTKEDAESAVNAYIQKREGKTITISVADHEIEATARELGLTFQEEGLAKKALDVGKQGNLWERFQESRQAQKGKRDIELVSEVDQETLADFVKDKCCVYNVKAKDSKIKYKNGKLIATKSKTGIKVQTDQTKELLEKAVKSEKTEPESVVAEVKLTQPEVTQEEASKCTDLLGKFSTTYGTYQVERSSNIATAAGRINGTIVYPGKVFSTVKVIKDRTEANGYKSAPEYSGGKVVSGIGGGVCQVSTTLYNAVINAELKVVERSPHSMVVAYVPVSRDAAISGDFKDFKFKNNTDYPIYIIGSASGGVLSFQIYGHETRSSSREISFESEITDTIQPGGEIVTEDSSLPSGYRSVTQSAHVGYRAKLWKVIKENGETERELVNTSSYNASPQYVTVGRRVYTPAPSTASPQQSPASGDAKDSEKNSDSKASGSKSSSSKAEKSSGSNTKSDTGSGKSSGSSTKSSASSGNSSGNAKSNASSEKSNTDAKSSESTATTEETADSE